MPVKRRESEEFETMAQAADRNWTIKNSPFGTSHTSRLRYRIVGSKLLPVVEDDLYPQPMTGREFPDARSRPMADKPNHVWPSQIQPPFAQEDPTFKNSSRSSDKFYDAISHVSKPQNDPLHPFSVLPPVRTDPNYETDDYGPPPQDGGDNVLQELLRRLPGSRLPSEPIRFAPNEVSFLMNRLHQELEGYVSQRLKDIYVEMTTFDRKLSGLIHFDDFVFAARKHQLKCDPALLRLVASMFVVPATPNFINYEKILSFIGAALKLETASNRSGYQGQQQQYPGPHQQYNDRRSLEPRGMPHVEPHEGWHMTPRSTGLKTANVYGERPDDTTQPPVMQHAYPEQPEMPPSQLQSNQPPPIPIPHQSFQLSPQEQLQQQKQQSLQQPTPPRQANHGAESPFRDRRRLEVEGNQAKLLSILHEALKDYTREDFNRLVDAFYLWDREKKGSLTVDDIKTVAYRQNLRVTNSVINALLDMCYVRWDQYDWRKFVKYIEAALPSTLGQDPASKQAEKEATKSQQVVVPSESMGGVKAKAASPRSSSPSSDAARAWFDRFMRLSKALYTVDSKYVGHLPPDDVRWITNEYNRVYELGLYEPDVEEAINVSSTHSGLVNIDSYLRSLSLRGHY